MKGSPPNCRSPIPQPLYGSSQLWASGPLYNFKSFCLDLRSLPLFKAPSSPYRPAISKRFQLLYHRHPDSVLRDRILCMSTNISDVSFFPLLRFRFPPFPLFFPPSPCGPRPRFLPAAEQRQVRCVPAQPLRPVQVQAPPTGAALP